MEAMLKLTTLTWKSITVLPSLVGASVGFALVVALVCQLPLELAVGVLVCALIFAELGYLCILILANRRDAVRSSLAPSKR